MSCHMALRYGNGSQSQQETESMHVQREPFLMQLGCDRNKSYIMPYVS